MAESRFAEPQASRIRNDKIAFKDRTALDDLTDVGWLPAGARAAMKEYYLRERGQYFENGQRVTA